jgi:hypothetical protein
VSPRIKEQLGYHPSEILGRTPFEMMPDGEFRRLELGLLLHLAAPTAHPYAMTAVMGAPGGSRWGAPPGPTCRLSSHASM